RQGNGFRSEVTVGGAAAISTAAHSALAALRVPAISRPAAAKKSSPLEQCGLHAALGRDIAAVSAEALAANPPSCKRRWGVLKSPTPFFLHRIPTLLLTSVDATPHILCSALLVRSSA